MTYQELSIGVSCRQAELSDEAVDRSAAISGLSADGPMLKLHFCQ